LFLRGMRERGAERQGHQLTGGFIKKNHHNHKKKKDYGQGEDLFLEKITRSNQKKISPGMGERQGDPGGFSSWGAEKNGKVKG